MVAAAAVNYRETAICQDGIDNCAAGDHIDSVGDVVWDAEPRHSWKEVAECGGGPCAPGADNWGQSFGPVARKDNSLVVRACFEGSVLIARKTSRRIEHYRRRRRQRIERGRHGLGLLADFTIG